MVFYAFIEEEQVYEQAILSKRYADARRVFFWNVDDLQNSSKAKRLLEIITEAEDDGRKVIVFSFFLDTIRKITELLGNKCLNPINGSVTPQRRQEIIDEFDIFQRVQFWLYRFNLVERVSIFNRQVWLFYGTTVQTIH